MSNKSLSISFQEISEHRATYHRPTPEELAAEIAEVESPTGTDDEVLLADPFAVVADPGAPDAG